MDAVEIPAKKNFKIGEVGRLFGLEPYVLRYWEKEFDRLKPRKTASGQRSYNRDDVELVSTIQHLLYTEMYTIAGARRQLERAELLELELPQPAASAESTAELEEVRLEADEQRERANALAAELDDARAELAALEAELARLESENESLKSQGDSGHSVVRERVGRQRRVLLEVRRELQEVANAARAVA